MNAVTMLDTAYEVTDEQVTALHRDGWVKLPGLLDRDLVTKIYGALAEVDTLTPSSAETWMDDPAYKKVLQLRDGMAWNDPFFRDLAVSPRLAHTAVRLMKGNRATFVLDMAFIKPAEHGGRTPMHQDFPHWPFDRAGTVTLWIALTDISAEMGPLQFLEGSHKAGPLGRYSRAADDDVREDYPWLESYPVVAGQDLAAGDATAHWDMTIHGSNPNQTADERAGYTLRYVPEGTRYTGSLHRHFDKFDLTANERFDEAADFPTIAID